MKKLLLFILLFIPTLIKSQNVIPNYSFEDLRNNHDDKPTLQNHLQYLNEWENLNTSDLFSTESGKFVGRFDPVNSISGPNCYTIGPYTMPANHQNKYIGFGPCEGAKVKFANGNKLEKGQWAKIKLHYAFRGNNTTTNLLLALSNSFNSGDVYNTPNNSNQTNNNDCADLGLPGYKIIKSYELTTASDKVPGVWYELETYILNENNESMDNFYILGNNVTSNIYGQSSNYIYIDNVSLEILDFCQHPCAYSNGPVQFGQNAINNNTTGNINLLPDAMVGNCDGCLVQVNGNNEQANRFTLLNKNVNIFKFTVYSSGGQIINKTELYSLSPLTDAGYSDWLFDWNGFGNIISADLPADVYVYNIEMQACNNAGYVNTSKSLTLLGILNPPAHQSPIPEVFTNETCCPNERYIQNSTFLTAHNYKHKVDEFILIGPEVNPSPFVQVGEVIFEPITNVVFEAGNFVEFIPGLTGINGAIDINMDLNTVLNNNVTVNIKPCISPNRLSSGTRDIMSYSNEILIIDKSQKESISNIVDLNPNIVVDYFILKSSLQNIHMLEIVDNNGKIAYTQIKTFREDKINCAHLSSGFYNVIVYLENGAIVHKKMVKVE